MTGAEREKFRDYLRPLLYPDSEWAYRSFSAYASHVLGQDRTEQDLTTDEARTVMKAAKQLRQ